MANVNHLESLLRKMRIVKDRINGLVHRQSNGVYMYGLPGKSKTHLVRSYLQELAVPYQYHSGIITPIGLFQMIEEHRNMIILLDDVSAIFKLDAARQILLAALGNTFDAGARIVTYRKNNEIRSVNFTGGIICISNLPLNGDHDVVAAALRDRVYMIHYNPSDDEIIALIHEIADGGPGGVSPEEAHAVAEFLLAESRARGLHPSVRLFVDKAIKDFKLHKENHCETDWRDLIVSNLEEQIIEPQFPMMNLRRAERKSAECRIALDICTRFTTRSERRKAWEARTGKSEKSLYKRCKDLKEQGLVAPVRAVRNSNKSSEPQQ